MVTVGKVQAMIWSDDSLSACLRIGPVPTDTEALFVLLDGTEREIAYKSTMIDALSTALLARREVEVLHEDESALIRSVKLDTA